MNWNNKLLPRQQKSDQSKNKRCNVLPTHCSKNHCKLLVLNVRWLLFHEPPESLSDLITEIYMNKHVSSFIFNHSAPHKTRCLNRCAYFPGSNTSLPLFDLSDALVKMKGVYEQNPQLGDPSSLEPQITQTAQNLGRLKGELVKYEVIYTCSLYEIVCSTLSFFYLKKITFPLPDHIRHGYQRLWVERKLPTPSTITLNMGKRCI